MERILIKASGQMQKKGKDLFPPAFRYLSDTIELDPDFTLRSFFKLLKKYPELIQLSDLLKPLLSMAYQSGAYQSGASESEDNLLKTDEIDHLVFYKTISMKGFPGEPGIDIYNSLKGTRNNKDIGLKHYQMDSLLGHTMIIGKLKHIIFGDGQETFSYETFYTLFELIEGICWEMSFNFNPKQCVLRR